MAEIVAGLRVHSQADSRRTDNFEDQHGRPYWATVESKTGDPVGSAGVPDGWVAPNAPKGTWYRNRLTPPAPFKLILRGQDSRDPKRRGARIFIDYEAWLRVWDEAEAENERDMTNAIREDAKQKNMSMTQIEAMVKHPPEEAYKAFPPRASAQWPRQFIVACMRGNRWALGMPHPTTGQPMEIPEWAKPILDEWLKRQPMGTRSLKAVDVNQYPDADDLAVEGFEAVVSDWSPTDEIPKPTAQKTVEAPETPQPAPHAPKGKVSDRIRKHNAAGVGR